jgi:hypothetical protein
MKDPTPADGTSAANFEISEFGTSRWQDMAM